MLDEILPTQLIAAKLGGSEFRYKHHQLCETHWVHDKFSQFPCVESFTSPGTDSRYKGFIDCIRGVLVV